MASAPKAAGLVTEIVGLAEGIDEVSLAANPVNGISVAIMKDSELIEAVSHESAIEKDFALQGAAATAASGISRLLENFKDCFGAAELVTVAKAHGLDLAPVAQKEPEKMSDKTKEAPEAQAPAAPAVSVDLRKELDDQRAAYVQLQKELQEERAIRRATEIAKEAESLSAKEAGPLFKILKALDGDAEAKKEAVELVKRYEAAAVALKKELTKDAGGAGADITPSLSTVDNVAEIQKIQKESKVSFSEAAKMFFAANPSAYDAERTQDAR